MKTTVVPAQITTVEDRIAGNLTFTQIILMVIPLLTCTAIYVGIPPLMHIGAIKFVLIVGQILIFGGLALRYRGKILADWLIVYLRFAVRPREYIFTKNDITARDAIITVQKKEPRVSRATEKQEMVRQTITFLEQLRINRLFENPDLSVRFKLARKGGIDVSLEPVEE